MVLLRRTKVTRVAVKALSRRLFELFVFELFGTGLSCAVSTPVSAADERRVSLFSSPSAPSFFSALSLKVRMP
jgi:hypothetical protein